MANSWKLLRISRFSGEPEPQDIHGGSSFVDLKLAQLPHAGEPSVSPHDQRSADLPPSPIVSLEPNSPNGSLLFHERKYVRAHLHVKVRELRRFLPNEVEKVHLRDQRDVRETSVEST
jgi:hypothetical protein